MIENTKEFKKFVEKNLVTDVLPRDTSVYNLEANSYGVTKIDDYRTYAIDLATDTEKHITTGRYGFSVDGSNEAFWPHYVKHYNLTSVGEILDRIMVSSTLEGGTTPLETYAVALNTGSSSLVGSSVIDLKSLLVDENTPVKTARLDEILRAAGYKGAFPDLNSFLDIQNFIENKEIQKLLTPRAMVAVALESYFIPNAIGETDPNSRNILLADHGLGKFDVVFRIDAESNTYLRDVYKERSGKGTVPKGIYSANEDLDTEFLPNIRAKHYVGGPKIDWELFAGFMHLTEYFIRNSYIDNAIFQGYLKNQYRYIRNNLMNESRYPSPFASRLSQDAYAEFSKKTQERIKNYTTRVQSALGYVKARYPFDLEFNAEKVPTFEPAFMDGKGRYINKKGDYIDPADFQPSL
ncbi:MAG: hypothetical protein IKD36_03150 [Clostridia bacterium]|nr:hypothetical protein [Clostridia bacterium]